MTITMSEHLDAEPCDVLRGGDGPVYFLVSGSLYVVHEILGRWIEADGGPAAGSAQPPNRGAADAPVERVEHIEGVASDSCAGGGPAHLEAAAVDQPVQVEHWLVTASAGRFGPPAVYRLQRRPASPGIGPDTWTVRAQRR